MAAVAPPVFPQNSTLEKTFFRGTEALRQGRLDAAAQDFTDALSASPNFAPAHFNLGLVRLQQGRIDEAVASLSKSVSLQPTLRGANLFLGIAYYRNDAFEKAALSLSREARLDPKSADALMWLGVVELAQDNPTAAVANLDKAAALRPKDVDILYHRGRAHMLVSMQDYQNMYEVAPDSWRVHQVLAQSFVEAGRLDEAVLECQKALQAKPQEPGLHQALGDVYLKKNNLEKAEAEYQSELKISPRSLATMFGLAVVSIDRSKPEVAADLLRQVLAREPGSTNAQYQMGRANALQGKNDDAIRNFSAVVAASTQADPETLRQAYFQLSQLYRRQKQPDESRAALEAFTKLKEQADARQQDRLQDKLRRAPESQESAQ
jgi:tetratricopeptide (TPR) repeat protein